MDILVFEITECLCDDVGIITAEVMKEYRHFVCSTEFQITARVCSPAILPREVVMISNLSIFDFRGGVIITTQVALCRRLMALVILFGHYHPLFIEQVIKTASTELLDVF